MKQQKLTDKDLTKIKNLLKSKKRNMTAIAREFNVTRNLIYYHAWKNNWLDNPQPKTSIKDKFKKIFPNRCYFCKKRYSLIKHHRNQNPKDNIKRNLITLCSSCHKKLHNLLPKQEK